MKHLVTTSLLIFLSLLVSCKDDAKKDAEKTITNASQSIKPISKGDAPFIWEGANVYFLLADRFKNGDPENDKVLDRTKETGVLRGFEGGDIKGVIQKIEDGYFTDLGINALWINPLVEQLGKRLDSY